MGIAVDVPLQVLRGYRAVPVVAVELVYLDPVEQLGRLESEHT